MPGHGGISRADEQLMARFSGRVDHRVGRFLGRPRDDRWVWDQVAASMLGGAGPDATLSLQTLLQHVPEDERELAAQAFQEAVEHGEPVLLSCRLRSADGTCRSVLITAEVMEAEPSGLSMAELLEMDGLSVATGPWLAGNLIDLTALRLDATRMAVDHAVAEVTRHRAVIEQAKGIIMLGYGVDADAAFLLLSRHSQDTNTKLHELAARLVDQVTELGHDTASARLDALLKRPT